jgi:hypothetical protein
MNPEYAEHTDAAGEQEKAALAGLQVCADVFTSSHVLCAHDGV